MHEKYYDFETYMRFILETLVPTEFQPSIYYNKDGDEFEIYWKSDSSYAKEVKGNGKNIFALHHSVETDEVVGITVYGIKRILKKESMLTDEPNKIQRDKQFSEWLLKKESECNGN